MSDKDCCSHRHPSTPSVYQTLEELDFERGIWSAALYGDLERVEKLLDNKTDPSVRDSSGYTALHYASRNGRAAVCQLLLRRGASVNAQTPGGATPLHRAAFRGFLGLLEILLRSGADPTLCDSDGKTPLHKAAEGGREGVAKRLLEADPQARNKRDLRGRTPADCVASDNEPLRDLLRPFDGL